jgi:flavin-dependent thymidylate synthase
MITNKICKTKDLTDAFKIMSIDSFKTGYCNAVVDSARASFNKSADNFTSEQNNKLVDYLKKHNHKSPFFHAQMCFVLHTNEWLNFICYAMQNTQNGLLHQDDLSSVNYYIEKELSNLTYIRISSFFFNRLIKYAEKCNFDVNVVNNLDELNVLTKNNLNKDRRDLNLCIFNPTSEWLSNCSDILEASRLLTFNCLIETPLFVFNQLVKHRKAEVNTRSYRYVKDAELEFYQPKKWRKQSENNKQGSKVDEFVVEELSKRISYNSVDGKTIENNGFQYFSCVDIIDLCNDWYKTQIENEMAGEKARLILPQSTFTSFVWTFSLNTFTSIVKQRISPDAQLETQEVVQEVLNLVKTRYPEFDKICELLSESNY